MGWSATKAACCRSAHTAGIMLPPAVRSRDASGKMAGSEFTIASSGSKGRRSSNGLVRPSQWWRRNRFLIHRRSRRPTIPGNRNFRICGCVDRLQSHDRAKGNEESRAKPARHLRVSEPKTSARELHPGNTERTKPSTLWEGLVQPIASEPVRRLGLGYASGATPMRVITLAA
jgi:hypothetical protein